MLEHRHQDVALRVARVESLDVLLRRLGRRMHGVIGQVREEWFILVPLDE